MGRLVPDRVEVNHRVEIDEEAVNLIADRGIELMVVAAICLGAIKLLPQSRSRSNVTHHIR
jgi:hypothetical protein